MTPEQDLLVADLSYLSRAQELDAWRFLTRTVEKIPSGIPSQLISDYVEERRVLPSSSPFPGRWSNRRTPYLIEIMDNMSIRSDVQQQAIDEDISAALHAMQRVIADRYERALEEQA